MTTAINLDLYTVPGVQDVLLQRATLQRLNGVVGLAEYLEVLASSLEPMFDHGDPQILDWAERLDAEGDAILAYAPSEHPAHRAAALIIADEVARLRIAASGGAVRTLQ